MSSGEGKIRVKMSVYSKLPTRNKELRETPCSASGGSVKGRVQEEGASGRARRVSALSSQITAAPCALTGRSTTSR